MFNKRNKHLYHIEPLVPYVESGRRDPSSVLRTTASMACWNVHSEVTGHVEVHDQDNIYVMNIHEVNIILVLNLHVTGHVITGK